MAKRIGKLAQEKRCIIRTIEAYVGEDNVSFNRGDRSGNSLKPGLYVIREEHNPYNNGFFNLRLKPKEGSFKGSESVRIVIPDGQQANVIDVIAALNFEKYRRQLENNGISTQDLVKMLKKYSNQLELGKLALLEEIFYGPGFYQVELQENDDMSGIAVAHIIPAINGSDSICPVGVNFNAKGKNLNYLPEKYIISLKE